MRRLIAVAVTCLICSFAAMAHGQQIDVAFAGGSLNSPGNSFSSGTFLPAEGGGAFVGFNGDVLFEPFLKGNVGVQAEVNWKGSQGMYGGQIPYRPLFYDFNAMYARRFSKYFGAEAMAGIGAESIRFYSNSFNNCDFYGNCTNYMSSKPFHGRFWRRSSLLPIRRFLCSAGNATVPDKQQHGIQFEPPGSLRCLGWLRFRREQIRVAMHRGSMGTKSAVMARKRK